MNMSGVVKVEIKTVGEAVDVAGLVEQAQEPRPDLLDISVYPIHLPFLKPRGDTLQLLHDLYEPHKGVTQRLVFCRHLLQLADQLIVSLQQLQHTLAGFKDNCQLLPKVFDFSKEVGLQRSDEQMHCRAQMLQRCTTYQE